MGRHPLATLLLALPLLLTATAHGADTVIDVERAPEKVPAAPLMTTGYRPAQRERPFLEKTPKDERTAGTINDKKTAYDLAARKGKRVAWFGVVRGVSKGTGGRYELLLEHKYFDGLTDAHILALSFNGAGDFKGVVAHDAARGEGTFPIRPLMLVRVYGVVREGRDAVPVLHVEYARVFPWKTFTFLDCYGKDATNPQWRKLCKVPLDDIYDSQPDDEYYRRRLGSEAGQGAEKTTD